MKLDDDAEDNEQELSPTKKSSDKSSKSASQSFKTEIAETASDREASG